MALVTTTILEPWTDFSKGNERVKSNNFEPVRPVICHLSSCHHPFDIRIFKKECSSLAEGGYRVNLVVPHDHNQSVDGIQIWAMQKPKNRIERFLFSTWRIFHTALETSSTIYHFHDPDLIPVGLLLKAVGKKVIYDVHEDVPKDILDKEYLPKFSRPVISEIARWVEKIGASAFDGIVAATQSISRNFPAKKTVLVQNFPMLSDFSSQGPSPYSDRPYVIAYVGGITKIRGIRQMIQAMEFLPEEYNAKLLLAGQFESPEVEAEMRNLPGWRHVDFRGWQSRDQVAELLLQEARLGIVVFHPIANHVEATPNKIFEYMAAGLPVVASNFDLWRGFFEKENCGVVVDPMNPKAIAEAIRWIFESQTEAEEMGKRGKEAVWNMYNWGSEAKKLLHLYHELAGLTAIP